MTNSTRENSHEKKPGRTDKHGHIPQIALAATLMAATPFIATGPAAGDTIDVQPEPSHVVQFVRFESNLPRDVVLEAAKERKPQFEATPGLVQKYYLELDAPNSYGGIYIWKDKASMSAFMQSDLFKTIPAAYGISEKPQVEIIRVLFPLRQSHLQAKR